MCEEAGKSGASQGSARMHEICCSDVKKIDKKVRCHFHDDITVSSILKPRSYIQRLGPGLPALTTECPRALIFVLKLSRVILDTGKSSRSNFVVPKREHNSRGAKGDLVNCITLFA